MFVDCPDGESIGDTGAAILPVSKASTNLSGFGVQLHL